MPKTIEITVYKFNELNDKAKEKARDNYLTNWMHDDWRDCTIDYMKEEGEKRHCNREATCSAQARAWASSANKSVNVSGWAGSTRDKVSKFKA